MYKRALRIGQHDEPALGAGRLDRGVQHHGQHFVEDALGPHRPECGKQRRDLAKLSGSARATVFTGATIFDEKHQRRAAVSALDLVLVHQSLFEHPRTVDVGAVFRVAIPDHVTLADQHDFSVLPRHLVSRQDQIAVRSPADSKDGLVDGDHAMAERIANAEPRR